MKLPLGPRNEAAVVLRGQRRVAAGRRQGLGDLVERVLRPGVRWADRRLGTRLGGCAGCRRRKRWLNRVSRRGWIRGALRRATTLFRKWWKVG